MARNRSGKKRWVRTVVVGGALVALAAAGFIGYRAWRGTDETPVTYVTKQAAKMTLISSVSGTGNVVLGHTESVSPSITGDVSGLVVKVGDMVTEGQLLFTIVNPQLDLNLSSATASYDEAKQSHAQAELSVLKAEQTLSELKKQRAAQTSASAEVTPTVAVAAASSVARAAASVDGGSASRSLASVTTASTITSTTIAPPSTSTTLPPTSSTTVAPATTSTTLAPTTTSSAPSPPSTTPTTNAPSAPNTGGSTGTTSSTVTALDIKIATAQVASAEVAVTVSQTKVESAAYAVEQATKNAAARQVTAPMSGTVTSVGISDGDQWGSGSSGGTSSGGTSVDAASTSAGSSSSTSGTAAVVMSDLGSFETTVALGETDVVGVKAGNKVTLTFDALPDLTLVGEVKSVATSGTVSQGVVSYDVTIVPGTGNEGVKAGMTVTAEIITLSKPDVLAVPNGALKTDSSGGSYVLILTDGKPVTQTVEIGMASDAYTEIATGLTEGQAVVTQTVGGSTTNTTSGNSSGGILGTGSGFPTGPADGGGPPPGFGGGG